LGTRIPNTDKIGLRELGMTMNREGFIQVDAHFQSNLASIYATGDVIGLPGQASTSFTQGQTAASHMFGIPHYEVAAEIPYGMYGIPELSGIGLTEAEARATANRVGVGRARFRNLTKASISNNKDGLLKIIFDADTLQLLGVHIIGETACDLIHLAQAVMGLQGDLRYFTNHVFNYPTYAEAYRQAAFNGLNEVSNEVSS
jgi:NAD(P) transhydrogenase